MKDVAAAVEGLDQREIQDLQDGGSLVVAGCEITADDIVIQRTPRPGVIVATEGSVSVALDTTLTEPLIIEGLARELIASVQQLRREAGLDVSDRIVLEWESADPEIAMAFEQHSQLIAQEVLATAITAGSEAQKTEAREEPRPRRPRPKRPRSVIERSPCASNSPNDGYERPGLGWTSEDPTGSVALPRSLGGVRTGTIS